MRAEVQLLQQHLPGMEEGQRPDGLRSKRLEPVQTDPPASPLQWIKVRTSTAHLDLFCVSMFEILLHDGVDHFFQLLLIHLWHDRFINRVPLCSEDKEVSGVTRRAPPKSSEGVIL